MIVQRVYSLAEPQLARRRIETVQVGLALMAVELDDGSIGVTYTLRREIGEVCSAFPGETLEGMRALEMAGWAVEGRNVLASGLGLAVLNAASPISPGEKQGQDALEAGSVQPGDTVGIVGHIGPVIRRLQGRPNQMYIFEKDGSGAENVQPGKAQKELLPRCQVVFFTSATLINGTLDEILSYCTGARAIVMTGSSTPLYPEAFRNTGVTALAGTRWLPENREAIFRGVGQCVGMKRLIRLGEKITLKVPENPGTGEQEAPQWTTPY